MFNVKDFGAFGDGITDDRPAIQAALDAAVAAGGGIIYLPKGVYVIASYTTSLYALTLGSGITVRGDGPGATQLKILASRPNTALFQAGFPTAFPTLSVKAMAQANHGDPALTFLTPSDAASFVAGDDIFIRGGINSVPASPTSELNRVTAVDLVTGLVTLRRPLARTYLDDGVNPYGAACATACTLHDIAFERFSLESPIIPFAVSQIRDLTFRDLAITILADVGDVPVWTDGFLYHVRCARVGLFSSAPATSEGIIQIANCLDWTWECCTFNTTGCACVQITEGSAFVRFRGCHFVGQGFVTAQGSSDVDFDGCEFTLRTNAPCALQFVSGGAALMRLRLTHNRLHLSGTTTGIVLAGDDLLLSHNQVICHPDAAHYALVLSGSTDGIIITGNDIAVTNPENAAMVLDAGTSHRHLISGNLLQGAGPTIGIDILDTGVQAMGPALTGNIIRVGLGGTGISMQTPAHEAGYRCTGNVVMASTPYNPSTLPN